MLYRLEIENFYSIRDAQIIDLRAAGNAPEDSDHLAPLWRGSTEKAPKVVAIFGPNASGKSTVLRALSFIAWFVQNSFSAPPEAQLPFERFNDADSQQAPTRLAIHVGGIEDIGQIDNHDAPQCRYAYELVIGGGPQHTVLSETLHYYPSTARGRVQLFSRGPDGKVSAAKVFDLGGYRQVLQNVLRPNASVISTLAQLKHPYGTLLWESAATVVSNILIYKGDGQLDQFVKHYAANPGLVEKFNREIERVDFGVRALELHQGSNGPRAFFLHEGLSSPLPLFYESHGTQQFFKHFPALLQTLETGGVAVLDELDAAIHPVMLSEILRWFHDRQRNPHDAQLWMSCHNVSLLEELSKEEVLFCTKDRGGRTEVYGLRNIQAVRRTDNYYKKYLGGAYGALPHIG